MFFTINVGQINGALICTAAARTAARTHERSALQSHARTSLRTLDGTQPVICDAQTTPSPSQTGSTNTAKHRGRHARIARRTTAWREVVHHVFRRRGSRYEIQFRGCRVGIAVHVYGAVGGGKIGRVGMALGSWSSKKTCRKYGRITRHEIVAKRGRDVS